MFNRLNYIKYKKLLNKRNKIISNKKIKKFIINKFK